MSEEIKLNIYQRVNKVQQQVKYVQKDAVISGGGTYKAVTHDQVVSVIRRHLVENGIVVYPEQIRGSITKETKTKSGTTGYLYQGEYAINFVNIDNPEDKIISTIEAHALDYGDKAPGKAITYATKAALLKVFCLETGENDESRNASGEPYTDAQKDAFDTAVLNDDGLALLEVRHMVGDDVYTALVNSGEKGKKVELKKKCSALERVGHSKIDSYANTVKEYFESDDVAVVELIDELTPLESKLTASRLNDEQVAWVKEKRAEASE